MAAGRRFGKTRLSLAIALEYAINMGLRVWWVAPSYSVSDKQWRQVKRMLTVKGKGMWTGKNEVSRHMEFYFTNADGSLQYGEIDFRSGDRPDNLRGDGLDLIIFDEAAFIDPAVWKVLRPSLADRRGQAIFISTPNGLNYFYKLFMRGQDTNFPLWKSWHFTSYDNPFIPKAEIDDAKTSMTKAEFEEEHLAIFAEGNGRVFRNVQKLAICEMLEGKQQGHMYSMGIDFGRRSDSTVISVVDITTGRQVWLDRFNETDFATQRNRIRAAYYRWRPAKIYAEQNTVGAVVIEDLQDEIENLVPIYMTNPMKTDLIQSLALAIEKGQILLLNDETDHGKQQLNELRVFEQRKAQSGLTWKFTAPKGFNDDTVMALALAWRGVEVKPARLEIADNPFYDVPKAVPQSSSQNPFAKSAISQYRIRSHQLQKALLEKYASGNQLH